MPKVNTMSADELKELQDAVAAVGVGDVLLGRVLDKLVLQLARISNLDYPVVLAPVPETPAEASAP